MSADINNKNTNYRLIESLSFKKSIRATIAIVLFLGFTIPTVIGTLSLQHIRSININVELKEYLHERSNTLANSLILPVWNYDIASIDKIINASLLDRQLHRIVVSDDKKTILTEVSNNNIISGKIHTQTQKIVFPGEVIGYIKIYVDDSYLIERYKNEEKLQLSILVVQIIFSLSLIFITLHFRLIKPILNLNSFAQQLSHANFDIEISSSQTDEIGELSKQFNTMRIDLKSFFSEQKIILSNIPVGVIFVKNGIIHLANNQANIIFGYESGQLINLPCWYLFLSKNQFFTIRSRALSFTKENTNHENTDELQLRRHDGSVFWAMLKSCTLDITNPTSGSIWVIEDISARKQAENEINPTFRS